MKKVQTDTSRIGRFMRYKLKDVVFDIGEIFVAGRSFIKKKSCQ